MARERSLSITHSDSFQARFPALVSVTGISPKSELVLRHQCFPDLLSLLEEQASTSRIGLSGFYIRRSSRIFRRT